MRKLPKYRYVEVFLLRILSGKYYLAIACGLRALDLLLSCAHRVDRRIVGIRSGRSEPGVHARTACACLIGMPQTSPRVEQGRVCGRSDTLSLDASIAPGTPTACDSRIEQSGTPCLATGRITSLQNATREINITAANRVPAHDRILDRGSSHAPIRDRVLYQKRPEPRPGHAVRRYCAHRGRRSLSRT